MKNKKLRLGLSMVMLFTAMFNLQAQDFGFVLIKSNPGNAMVIINGRDTGQRTPYQAKLDKGVYSFTLKLEEKNYHDYKGRFEINAGKTSTVEADLKPNFGDLYVESNPTGASIRIDNSVVGSTPATIENLKSGKYVITLSKENYNDLKKEVLVEDSKTTRITLDLLAGYGTVGIRVKPDDAGIYIDGDYKKEGSFSGQLTAGKHMIEVKLDQHYPISREISISEGKEMPMFIELKPIKGSLSIMVNPPETRIYLDGKYMGLSPMVISDLLIGQYNLELKKGGYANLKKTVKILENEVTVLEQEMYKGYNVVIESDPSAATVLKDNSEIGITPSNIILDDITTFNVRKKFYFDKLIEVNATRNDEVFHVDLDRANSNITINSNIKDVNVKLEPQGSIEANKPFEFIVPGGKTVEAGEYKLILSKEGYKPIREEVEFTVQGFEKNYVLHPVEYRTKGGAMLRSLIWPGLGQSWIKREGAEPLLGIVAWGTLAAGTYNYFKANNLYNEYLDSGSTSEREGLRLDYIKSQETSNMLFISAGIIWGVNMIWTMLVPSEEKMYRKLELTGNVDPYSGGLQFGFMVRR